MREAEHLERVLGAIYDAALDTSLRVPALIEVAAFVGGSGASLFAKDPYSRTGSTAYDFGISEEYKRLYFERYIRYDPMSVGQFFGEVGEPISVSDIVPYDEFIETRFFQDWVRPQGLVDSLTAILDKSATAGSFVSVFRHERHGVVDEEARRRMRLVVPHLRRAVSITALVKTTTAQARADSLADTLDCLRAGMFLLDSAGRILHANAAGHFLLEQGTMLRAVYGRLVAVSLETQRTLADVLADTAMGDTAVGARGVAMPLSTPEGDVYVAHVLPLTAGRRRAAAAGMQAAAALFVDKAVLGTSPAPEALAKHYKLTPTELRVLLATVEVGRIADVAEMLGIAESTVRTHLGRLYDKTGASRQPDLIKLVAKFSTPLLR
jgi:DNA-binding CsgD family transcriptional regulator